MPHAPHPIALLGPLLLAAAAVPGGDARAAGTGQPRLEILPRALAFDENGQTLTLTLRSAGDAPVVAGPFRIVTPGAAGSVTDFGVSGGGRQVLAPGSSTTVRVTYRATGAHVGRRQAFAMLLIGTDDPHMPLDTVDPAQGRTAGVAMRGGPDRGILGGLVFAPLFAIPVVLLWPRRRARSLRWVARAAAVVPLGLAMWLVAAFDPRVSAAHGNFGFQFVQHLTLSHAVGLEYYVGVDGLSVTLVLLAAAAGFVAVLVSSRALEDRASRVTVALLLLAETGATGVFVALDLGLLLLFWEVTLVAMVSLVARGDGPERARAAVKLALGAGAGSLLLLAATVLIYQASRPAYLADGTPVAHTLDLALLARVNDFGSQPDLAGLPFPRLTWVLLFLGFGGAIPIVPLHAAVPGAHAASRPGTSVMLAAVLGAAAAYCLLRVPWAVLPEATAWAAPAVAALGATGMIAGALGALGAADLRALAAYLSIAQTSACLIGLSALTPLGIQGALFQLTSQALVGALLFLPLGPLGAARDRGGERGEPALPPPPPTAAADPGEGGGSVGLAALARPAAPFAIAALAAAALPGLSGFIGPLQIFVGSFGPRPVATTAAALGLALTAGSAVRALPLARQALAGRALGRGDLALAAALAALILALGLYPAPLLDLVTTGVEDLLQVMVIPPVGLGGEQ